MEERRRELSEQLEGVEAIASRVSLKALRSGER